jgi:S1-C subfamily serine protease
VSHPVIGIGLDAVRPGDGTGVDRGVRVASVAANSPAQRAGLRQGDVVVAANGQPMLEPSQLVAAVERVGVGGRLSLSVNRQGSLLNLDVVPAQLSGSL